MTPTDIKPPNPGISFGYFFGYNLDFLQCEEIMVQLPAKFWAEEAALMKSKWFDYRRLHPTLATYLCAKMYDTAAQDANKIMSGKWNSGFKGRDFMLTREYKSFWRLRQTIDKLGVRYDFFIRKGMNWAIENGWLQAPRPMHLHTNEDMIADIMLAWEEEQKNILQIPKDDFYKVPSFFGHHDQLEWEKYIVEQIKSRRHKRFSLNSALYETDTLRIETAIREFDLGDVEDAINLAK